MHSVTSASHRLHTLISTKVFSRQCGCRTNSTKKTARSAHRAISLPSPPNDCSCAAYVWKRCLMIQSLVLTLVDIPFAVNAYADTSPRDLMNIDSPYYAPLVLRVKEREKKYLAVCAITGRSTSLSSHITPLEVSQSLALDLGITDKQYSLWTEMEMVSFSVLLNCRKYVHDIRPTHSANIVTGANGRCSWLKTNMKKLRSSLVRFRTATMCGASNVNSRLMLMVQSTRVMALRN